MPEQLAFDLRRAGQDRVERNAGETFHLLRELAIDHCRAFGTITADTLRDLAERRGITPHHFNVWGAMFRGKHWRRVGSTVSHRAEGHGNRIGVWVYEAGGE